jgi:hypothetical protein
LNKSMNAINLVLSRRWKRSYCGSDLLQCEVITLYWPNCFPHFKHSRGDWWTSTNNGEERRRFVGHFLMIKLIAQSGMFIEITSYKTYGLIKSLIFMLGFDILY